MKKLLLALSIMGMPCQVICYEGRELFAYCVLAGAAGIGIGSAVTWLFLQQHISTLKQEQSSFERNIKRRDARIESLELEKKRAKIKTGQSYKGL
jgi:hypothetical protein